MRMPHCLRRSTGNCMKILSRLLGVLLFVFLAFIAYLWLKPPELLRVGAGYAAKTVCSNVFLAHRDADEVLRTDVQAPGVSLLKLMRIAVDEPHATVRAGLFGFIGHGIAVYRPGFGCTTVPSGDVSALHAPVSAVIGAAEVLASPAPPVADASALWPEGRSITVVPVYQKILDDDKLVGPGMRAVVVVDHGRIVAERYAPGYSAETPLLGWSMAKTVTASLVGLLAKDGRLSVDQAAFWPAGDGREAIKMSDLLSMSSGLKFNEDYGAVSDVTRMLYLQPDAAGFAYAQPLAHPIGTVWSYSSGTANIVARIVQDIGGPDFPQARLFRPLGMQSAVMELDEHGTLVGSSYMYATGRDWARFGLFLAQNGVWQGQPLLPAGYVDMMAAPTAPSLGEYGHGFVWLWASDSLTPGKNPDGEFGIPNDTFYLSGHDGQTVAVIRSRQLVVVRLGLTPYTDHYTPQRLLQAVLMAAPAP
jgi:CubicO group peptidase (beta-lactamase class C family)